MLSSPPLPFAAWYVGVACTCPCELHVIGSTGAVAGGKIAEYAKFFLSDGELQR